MTLLWVLTLVLTPSAMAQALNISGIVSDPTGDVLIGVSVSVKGNQTHGTMTGIDGDYSLKNVPADATLDFSYVGYGAVEEPVKGRTKIDVIMHEDAELLDEVVVVGYGSTPRDG